MATSITIGNQKGGVAKSTTAVTLGYGLAAEGNSVLLIDLDPQGNLANLLGMRQESCVFDWLINGTKPDNLIRDTGRDRLYLMPGDKRTASASTLLAAESYQVTFLEGLLQPLRKTCDVIIMDTAPSTSLLQGAAVKAGDLLIIPSACDFLSIGGVAKLFDTIREIQAKVDYKGRLVGVLPTFYDGTKESRAILSEMCEKFGKDNVLSPIHRAAVLRECSAYGKTIYEFDLTSRAAEEYNELVTRVLKLLK
jgi:chromosome partitioning protein